MANTVSVEHGAGGDKVGGPIATLKRWGKFLISTGAVAAAVIFIFQNFILMPVISYDKNTDVFSTAAELRNATMHVRPQMVVRCGDTVILITHLFGYCEDEILYFSSGEAPLTASLTKANQKYANRLMSHIRTGVREELLAAGYSAEQVGEIEDQLFIYMTLLCGVTYETKLGNYVQRYCIIENDGILQDLTRSNDKIHERLFDYEIKIDDDDVDSIDTDEEVRAIIDTVVEEIEALIP